jgi:hypothetical protein
MWHLLAVLLGRFQLCLESVPLALGKSLVDFGGDDAQEFLVDFSLAVPSQTTIGAWDPME